MTKTQVAIIGAGLAGSEAAWQLANRGVAVTLYEMRPEVMTEAHKTGNPAELVCSNSFKSRQLDNAHGLLKAELSAAGSLIIETADKMSVPAGSALAVDRMLFAETVKKRLAGHDNIHYCTREIAEILPLLERFDQVIVASGPLTSASLSDSLRKLLNDDGLFFYDAIAPVIYADTIDMAIAFKASRYGTGDSDYINCPLDEVAYGQLIADLLEAEKVPFKSFEQASHFEGCLPIEVMAERGFKTLSFGPMKPVGLIDPGSHSQPYAVLQLRQENIAATLYNMVGCQTRMTWEAQKRVFRKIPGLSNCEFARMGSMHRNTYICAPKHLLPSLQLKANERVFLAGQITGVEGYTESTAMGLWAAMNLISLIDRRKMPDPERSTMTGGLVTYLVSGSADNFQPMNANFGLLSNAVSGGKGKLSKKEKRTRQAELALRVWQSQLKRMGWI